MSLGVRLEVRQGQGLVVTPQLQQAIKLLQLSNLELEAFVDEELERNPLLKRDETDSEAKRDATADSAELTGAPDAADARDAVDAPDGDLYGDASPGERSADRAGGDEGPGLVDWSRAGRGGQSLDDGDGFERLGAAAKTLHEHLSDQAMAAAFTPAEALIAKTLIDETDDGGYCRAALTEVAERLGCPVATVESVLRRCQGFEPTGVMATSVPECLALQLRERDRFDPAMAALVGNLDLLARRDLRALEKVCGVGDEDLRDMIAELKGLTPRPGAAFGSEPVQAVVPDVYVRPDPLGGWKIELNTDTLPRLLVDRSYHARVDGSAKSDAEKAWVGECMAQASWLVKSLDQRARTILKVAGEIVRQQDAFLAFGVEFLRPLNLKTVADAIGMHESTVSRVTSNKYVSTPRGVFELKYFFTAAIASTDGASSHSAEAVRHRIKALIDAERSEADVLSDDRLVEILKEAGIDVARRTVAKYREALRIPSSLERKKRLKTA